MIAATAMRTIGAFLSLCVFLSSVGAWAAPADYTLGTGDKLRITVYGQADLTGDYAVGPSSTISMPLLGRVSVAGLSLDQLEKTLAEKLDKTAGIRDPKLSVDIIEYRPYFIMGAVENPGRYPFIVGMNVMEAISVAGGLRRGTQDAMVDFELGRLREKYKTVSDALATDMARYARLVAERDGLTTIAFPNEMNDLVLPQRVKELQDNETALRAQRGQALSTETSMLDSQKPIVKQEIEALEQQFAAKTRLQEINNTEMQEIEKLQKGGFVPLPRVMGLRRTATELESDKVQIQASIARSKLELARIDIAIQNLIKNRNIQITEDLKQSADEKAQAAITRSEVREQISGALGRKSVRETAGKLDEKFVIVRKSATGVEEIACDEQTPVLPGDVIKVPARLAPWSNPSY